MRHPHPGDAYCGDRDVHYVYKGEGGGQLKAKIRGGRVTFSGTKRFLQSSEIKVPGSEDQPALLHEQEAAGRTGGFCRRDKQTCSDPSLYTGVLGLGGRPARRDVNDLITSKGVRSIELSASDTNVFTAEEPVRLRREPSGPWRQPRGAGVPTTRALATRRRPQL